MGVQPFKNGAQTNRACGGGRHTKRQEVGRNAGRKKFISIANEQKPLLTNVSATLV